MDSSCSVFRTRPSDMNLKPNLGIVRLNGETHPIFQSFLVRCGLLTISAFTKYCHNDKYLSVVKM